MVALLLEERLDLTEEEIAPLEVVQLELPERRCSSPEEDCLVVESEDVDPKESVAEFHVEDVS